VNILALGAHPDDIEYGCGGTFLKYARKGMDIYFMVLTKGEFGGDPKIREKEQEAAMKLLGVKKIFWGGCVDTELPNERIIISKIDEVIKEIKLGRILMSFSYLKIHNKKLQITSAGMPPIYYHHKDTDQLEEIIIEGMPLGAMKMAKYETTEKTLKSGDTILLLTDGLPEQMNGDNEMFDYPRVKKYLLNNLTIYIYCL